MHWKSCAQTCYKYCTCTFTFSTIKDRIPVDNLFLDVAYFVSFSNTSLVQISVRNSNTLYLSLGNLSTNDNFQLCIKFCYKSTVMKFCTGFVLVEWWINFSALDKTECRVWLEFFLCFFFHACVFFVYC